MSVVNYVRTTRAWAHLAALPVRPICETQEKGDFLRRPPQCYGSGRLRRPTCRNVATRRWVKQSACAGNMFPLPGWCCADDDDDDMRTRGIVAAAARHIRNCISWRCRAAWACTIQRNTNQCTGTPVHTGICRVTLLTSILLIQIIDYYGYKMSTRYAEVRKRVASGLYRHINTAARARARCSAAAACYHCCAAQ